MRLKATVFVSIAFLTLAGGCSYVPMPSMPSMPWSSSKLEPDATAEALFDEGIRYFNEKNYIRAIDLFERIRSDHPFSPQVTPAELKIAEAYYRNKQYAEAITAFREFQAIHPTNENIPFVIYHLGLAHFDQFTRVDRDQNFTETAKGYFETVIKDYPKSPYAGPARDKLAKCLDYLAAHEFSVASFYIQQEKYPAARDRLEGIVRRYPSTPTAVEALYYLGEAYRLEKNSVKAALAYAAMVQRFPDHPLAQKAQMQLAEVSKERQDPLALLLMRDGRPQVSAPVPSPETAENRLKDVTLVAKQEVVHEEPGDEKGFLRRIADKLNPFAPSPPKKQDNETKREARPQVVKAAAEEERSPGFFASLRNGFGLFSKGEKASAPRDPEMARNIDASLQQRGVTLDRMATLQPPPSDVAKAAETKPAPPPTDTGALLSGVDSKLKQDGKAPDELPPTPEIAVGLRGPAPTTETSERPAVSADKPARTSDTAALLSGVDAGLKQKGIAPSQFEAAPPPSSEAKQTAAPKRPSRVELDTNLTLEKGPLFLDPSEVKLPEQPPEPVTKPQQAEKTNALSENLVKGAQPALQQQKPAETKTAAQKRKPDLFEEDEEKGLIDQLKDTANTIGKVLNPLKW
jgi:outer membrane protein assembly factor BamD